MSENVRNPELIQTIYTPYASDAMFFENNNSLYLIISNNKGDHSAHTTVYKWFGHHFDEIEIISTRSVAEITGFAFKNSQIFIILQNLPGKKIHSLVLEFKNEKIKKIQLLNTENPHHVQVLFQDGVPYILIFQDATNQIFYKWNGFEMELVNIFQWKYYVHKSVVVYTNLTPLLVLPQPEKVFVLKPHKDDIKLELTKDYLKDVPANFQLNSLILDINNGGNENSNITFIVGLSEDNIINIYAMSFRVHVEMEKEQDDALRKCFNNLHRKVYDRWKKLNQTKTTFSEKQFENAKNESSNLVKRAVNANNFGDKKTIEEQLETLKIRLKKVGPIVLSPEKLTKHMIIDKYTKIKGNIVAKNAQIKNLNVTYVNEKLWEPNNWLSYKKQEKIQGPVTIKKLFTTKLFTNSTSDDFFKDVLLKTGNQKLTGNIKINNLNASKILSEKINDVILEDVYKISDTETILGLKTFSNAVLGKADIDLINNVSSKDIIALLKNNFNSEPRFSSEVKIDNLEVNYIDHINWTHFVNSVFKVGEDNTIQGNLNAKDIFAKEITVKEINGVLADELMTKSTDQTITSNIEFNNIKATKIECTTVNEVNISKAVYINHNGTVINGPVIIDEIHVKKDLELIGKIDKSFFLKDGDRLLGTNESDLLQRYLGKVVVKGNLYVKDLSIFSNTTILLNGSEYNLNNLNEFWTKNSEQTIPIHVEALNGVSAPKLTTNLLNSLPVDHFALNSNETEIRSPLIFENITVTGDVILHNKTNNISFDLAKLAKEGVKNDGQVYTIKGKKVFKNSLKVQKLQADRLNGQDINLTPKNSENEEKKIKKLIVKGNLISNITAQTINGVDIEHLKENNFNINAVQTSLEMDFKNLTVENLYVNSINGFEIPEYLKKLENILSEKQLKIVEIMGNVDLDNTANLKSINGYNIYDFLNKGIPQDEALADLIGDIRFTGKIKIENLRARNINQINFPNLTQRLFYKKSNQNITGKYTFSVLKTDDLYTKEINKFNLEDLIDVTSSKPKQLFVPMGVSLKNTTFEKSITAENMMPCDLYQTVTKLEYPETQIWSKIQVIGNVSFLDEECDIRKILENSVKKNEENVISAPVIINSHLMTDGVTTSESINGINLTEIINEAVLADAEEEQVITGHKTFPTMEANSMTVLENSDIPVVNNIFVPELFKRIIHKDEVNNITILGKKTFFVGLQVDRFLSNKISGIYPDNIVDLENLKEIPAALCESLEVLNNLHVKYINNFEVDYILNNRLLTNISEKQVTNAVYFFDNLVIDDNLRTPKINEIEMKDVVFDLDKQKIVGQKLFSKNITVLGDVTIDVLNNIKVNEAFNNSLVRGSNQTINGSLSILKPVYIQGNTTVESINGYAIERVHEIIGNTSAKTEETAIYNMTPQIKSIILENLSEIRHMPKELMYIERSDDLQIGIRKAIDARVTIIKQYALIHILDEESHEKCNLPRDCKCPVQHTVEITPHHSVSHFLNKEQQRIYSYDDDTMTIHLTTNSVSTDEYCRTNLSKVQNEMSTLTWSITATSNATSAFRNYPAFFSGYISGAEFFTLNGKTYAIIARYYDPVIDTHDLDCIVIRLNEDKTSTTEIQKIPTRGAWSLYLLHTAQGVTLVIGQIAEQSYTEIYRFKEDTEKFELLRHVAYGCTKAVGVVLGTDSLIILANKEEPLQVLKYNPHFDNYYYYQMFAIDEPVVGLSVFYVGGFGISDAYLCIVTEENYRIYSFEYIDGWMLKSTGKMKGLRNLVPFELNKQQYLFAASTEESSLLMVVNHGPTEN